MELVGFSVLPFCLLLLSVFTTQQFRSWPAHVPITEREGGLFRHCCFGCPHRYLLCATAYFFANAALYLLLFGIASLAGLAGNASMPWLLLLIAIVVPDLPGLNGPRNRLRYFLQRYVFRPALPSPTEAQLWRELSRETPATSVSIHYNEDDPGSPDASARNARNWEHLLFLTALLQHLLENHPEHRRHAEIAELTGFVRHKTHALELRGVRNAELLELLLGCCYLAIARLVTYNSHSDDERHARLGELGLHH